jgi:radical SAM protein with 4Fe4S-binding SPASM domain
MVTQSGSSLAKPSLSIQQRLLAVKSSLKPHALRLYDVWETEWNFRFKRAGIRSEVEAIRSVPRNLHIEGTNVCNAKCTFCAYPQMERPKETMPMDMFRKIIDQYVEMGGRGVSLTPIVGDPFVDRHLFERLDYLDQLPQIRGFYFYTNGILMKPHVIEKLLKYGDKLRVYVSFGGFDRETYKAIMGVDYFDLVSQNIEAFVEAKRSTGAKTPLILALRCPPSNWKGSFWEKCKSFEKEKMIQSYLPPTFDSWAGKVKPEALKKVGLKSTPAPYKRGACELLFTKPIVLANGKVNACACRDVEAELVIGDLNESSLKELWAGQSIDELIQKHEQGEFPEVCKRCTWYSSIYNPRRRQWTGNHVVNSWEQDD